MSFLFSWFRSSPADSPHSGVPLPPSPSPFPSVESHVLVAADQAPTDSAPHFGEFATAAQLPSILATIEKSGPVKNRTALPLQLRLACQQGIDFALANYKDQLPTVRYIVLRTNNRSLVTLRSASANAEADQVLVIDLNSVPTLVAN
jgi:hypothetical protein